MSKAQIFQYRNYKQYLLDLVDSPSNRGLRSKLAGALRCQPAFISRVLNTDTHLSQEHGIIINQFLKHTAEEGHYFMLLLNQAKSGSKALESYYQEQIQEVLKQRQIISERIQTRSNLTLQDQVTYYSAWYYSAIHILLLIPRFQTRTAIAEYLGLPLTLVTESLDFLISAGLAVVEGNKFKAGHARIHLPKNSPLISKHHTNWRMQAIHALEKKSQENLHFSGPICISEEDAERIKSTLLDLIEKNEPVIRASKEEAVFCLALDFFRV